MTEWNALFFYVSLPNVILVSLFVGLLEKKSLVATAFAVLRFPWSRRVLRYECSGPTCSFSLRLGRGGVSDRLARPYFFLNPSTTSPSRLQTTHAPTPKMPHSSTQTLQYSPCTPP